MHQGANPGDQKQNPQKISLSIRRFWGKRGRREAKREGAKGKELLFLLPLPPPPSHISSPLP